MGKIGDYAARHGALGGLITFAQNPRRLLQPARYPGDIYSLPQKLKTLEQMGIGFAVLIDFSGNISRMLGSEFIARIGLRRVVYLALGTGFRCGHHLDTDGEAIREQVASFGTFTELVSPVREGGAPVSSSRIRQALLAGDLDGAAALLGRPYRVDLEGLRPERSGEGCCYDLGKEGRVLPPSGRYAARLYGTNSSEAPETFITLDSGRLYVPPDFIHLNAQSVELFGSQ
jgi:riboflavin kinase/FMN adenylyltransferase